MGPRLTLLSESPNCGDENYIETPVGVTAVLRSIAAAHARAALYLDEGHTALHTSVLAVTPPWFYFELGPDSALNSRVTATAVSTLVTADRAVPVQFAVENAELGEFDGREAFRAALPQRLLRLQRRDFFRLPGHTISSAVRCRLVPGHAPERTIAPTVVDISCGGMAIDIPTADGLLPDTSRHTCTIDFPGLGRIDTPLYVCSSREATLATGAPGRRYGIEFLNLDAKSVALIQRFINDEERRLVRTAKR